MKLVFLFFFFPPPLCTISSSNIFQLHYYIVYKYTYNYIVYINYTYNETTHYLPHYLREKKRKNWHVIKSSRMIHRRDFNPLDDRTSNHPRF